LVYGGIATRYRHGSLGEAAQRRQRHPESDLHPLRKEKRLFQHSKPSNKVTGLTRTATCGTTEGVATTGTQVVVERVEGVKVRRVEYVEGNKDEYY